MWKESHFLCFWVFLPKHTVFGKVRPFVEFKRLLLCRNGYQIRFPFSSFHQISGHLLQMVCGEGAKVSYLHDEVCVISWEKQSDSLRMWMYFLCDLNLICWFWMVSNSSYSLSFFITKMEHQIQSRTLLNGDGQCPQWSALRFFFIVSHTDKFHLLWTKIAYFKNNNSSQMLKGVPILYGLTSSSSALVIKENKNKEKTNKQRRGSCERTLILNKVLKSPKSATLTPAKLWAMLLKKAAGLRCMQSSGVIRRAVWHSHGLSEQTSSLSLFHLSWMRRANEERVGRSFPPGLAYRWQVGGRAGWAQGLMVLRPCFSIMFHSLRKLDWVMASSGFSWSARR